MKAMTVVPLGLLLFLPGAFSLLDECTCNLTGTYTGLTTRKAANYGHANNYVIENGTFAVDFDKDILRVSFAQNDSSGEVTFNYLNFFEDNIQFRKNSYTKKCEKNNDADKAAWYYRFHNCVPVNTTDNSPEDDPDVTTYEAPDYVFHQYPIYKMKDDCQPVSIRVFGRNRHASYFLFYNFQATPELSQELLTKDLDCAAEHYKNVSNLG